MCNAKYEALYCNIVIQEMYFFCLFFLLNQCMVLPCLAPPRQALDCFTAMLSRPESRLRMAEIIGTKLNISKEKVKRERLTK